jgi:hypothetical protein
VIYTNPILTCVTHSVSPIRIFTQSFYEAHRNKLTSKAITMIKVMRDLPKNVLGVLASGEITGADYDTILKPAVEAKIKTYSKVRMLYHIGKDFSGFELGAIWEDAKLGIQHLSAWERLAVVSDHETVNSFLRFFGHLISGEIRIYKDAELENAKEWIAEGCVLEPMESDPTPI